MHIGFPGISWYIYVILYKKIIYLDHIYVNKTLMRKHFFILLKVYVLLKYIMLIRIVKINLSRAI